MTVLQGHSNIGESSRSTPSDNEGGGKIQKLVIRFSLLAVSPFSFSLFINVFVLKIPPLEAFKFSLSFINLALVVSAYPTYEVVFLTTLICGTGLLALP